MSTQPNSPQPPPGRAAVGNVPRSLDAATPVLFLPVNIETRFMDVGDGVSQLWVRIYPDQIAINNHETDLTQQEITDGTTYWDAVWSAGNPPASLELVKAPWRGLASLYGAQRAAWIALQMTPNNVKQQPAAATPDGTAPSPAPDYPKLQPRSAQWTQTPVAGALPDFWTVVAVSGTQTFQFRGGAITPNLAVGLTPPAVAFPPGSPVDANMQWLIDFDIAVQVGMALKIALTQDQRANGFDRIFVYGLSTQGSGTDVFSSLLDAHHYTDGFSLVPQGAPTNNTPDADSAYSRKDTDYEISFAVERQGPLTADPNADQNAFAHWLGIDPADVAHVGPVASTGELNGKDMLTALWPSTLGYFLSQMMADVFTLPQIEVARQYVIANALPRGPVPAFRVGKTPYGVLPVTSLRRYPATPSRLAGSVEPGLVTFLSRLWPNWLESSSSAPHMQNTGDPDAQLTQVLGMDASSMTFRGRQVMGAEFLWNYVNFVNVEPSAENIWWANFLSPGRQLLNHFQYTDWDPRVIKLGLANSAYPVPFPTVQSGPLSETDPLKADADLGGGTKGNYIQWLRQATLADIQAENYPGPKPTSLLYRILRQSLLQEYANQATNAEVSGLRLQISQVHEQEIIGVQPQAPPTSTGQPPPKLTMWQVLARPSIPNPQVDWADYLFSLDPPPESPFAQLADLRASLDRLARLSTAELDRLLTETLDACSHRLDVWVTAVATAMLGRTRSAQNNNVHLGAYGWVEEVRPATQRPPVAGQELAAVRQLDARRANMLKKQIGLPVPVQPAVDNGGFILAPSLAQASVAAVLRNGYMTHKGTPDESMLSIDLSSERVRKALSLLQGVQQGQSLNALLGYLFEDGLHTISLDKYAQPFRDKFPIVADKLTPSSDPSESVAASNVVDGLALRTAWDNGKLASGQNWGTGLPNPATNPADQADQTKIIGLLQTIDDYADALGDLSLSEAVFHIIRGNFGQAGTLMDAISKGARPPDPGVINTPRGGLDLMHRVNILFAGDPSRNAAWNGLTERPRAAAEPWLDAWLSQLLPDPANVQCTVSYDLAGPITQTFSLRDLDVEPLDVLAMADAGQNAQKGELENRILLVAAVPAGAKSTKINFEPTGLSPDTVSFSDAFFLAKSLRSLITSSRALTPQDMTVPEVNAAKAGGTVDLLELGGRAKAARDSLTNDLNALNAAIPGLPGAPDPVRKALLACSFYGVAGSIPLSSSGPDANLATQAASVAKILQDRLTQSSAVNIATATAADLVGVLTTIFGEDFAVLPRFTAPKLGDLQLAFGQSSNLVASDPQAPSRWLLQLSHIRPGISRLASAFTLAQLLNDNPDASSSLLLGQLPLVANDKWLGLGIDPANPPAKGRVAFACVTQGDPVHQNTYAGLLVDEWPERIPSTQENTAVAFHYEEPKARAPQAVLLGVCPDDRRIWDDDLILGILQETLELAKIRTVDLDSVQQVGQILPALYFAMNLQGATISTKFAMLEEVSRVPSILR